MLLIESKGEARVESFTILGYTTSRGDATKIGQFGTGAKHSINVLLRHKVEFHIYSGKNRIDFSTKVIDGIEHVMWSVNKSAPKQTGWTLQFGELDWDNLDMAVRDIISNALDADADPTVTITDKPPRAKAGVTRFYIDNVPTVEEYYRNLGTNIPALVGKVPEKQTDKFGVYRKSEFGPVHIYRKGVLVNTLKESGLYDYDFPNMKIDDSRNSDVYFLRAQAAQYIAKAPMEFQAELLRCVDKHGECFEAGLDADYLCSFGGNSTLRDAFLNVFNGKYLATTVVEANYAIDRGLQYMSLSSGWNEACKRVGCPTVGVLMTESEKDGIKQEPATESAIEAVDWAWDLLAVFGTVAQEKPPVFCYTKNMVAGATEHGYCNSEGVFIDSEIADGGLTSQLKLVALEECIHWETKSTDMSRDFQQYLLKMIVRLAK